MRFTPVGDERRRATYARGNGLPPGASRRANGMDPRTARGMPGGDLRRPITDIASTVPAAGYVSSDANRRRSGALPSLGTADADRPPEGGRARGGEDASAGTAGRADADWVGGGAEAGGEGAGGGAGGGGGGDWAGRGGRNVGAGAAACGCVARRVSGGARAGPPLALTSSDSPSE